MAAPYIKSPTVATVKDSGITMAVVVDGRTLATVELDGTLRAVKN